MRDRINESVDFLDDQKFVDDQKFQDEIHGPIYLNNLERDVVDTPEFRRLSRISQLGFIRLLYPAADHTRFVHSIGACAVAKELVQRLNRNNAQLREDRSRWGTDFDRIPTISRAETVLISLGALLHDIPHGPFSHDIEKKTHWIFPRGPNSRIKVKSHYGPYEKHDDFERNPILYVTLMDHNRSVLARVLRHHSPQFLHLLRSERSKPEHHHIKRFVSVLDQCDWKDVEHELLPSLVFHLLVFEEIDEGLSSWSKRLATSFEDRKIEEWGLGPQSARKKLHRAWYEPYRHDIIGNTLSADLLDYLRRDQRRLGMNKDVDHTLLDFYVLAPDINKRMEDEVTGQVKLSFEAAKGRPLCRCAVDLNDYKRWTLRDERVTDIFRLLDLRHEIHEKAVYHRVVQAGIAMLSRAIFLLGENNKPSLNELYGFDSDSGSPALAGEEQFLRKLIDATRKLQRSMPGERAVVNHSLPQKLAERRIYRPLLVVPGYRVPRLLDQRGNSDVQYILREFSAVVDSPYYAPFFLYISWGIGKLLEHAIDSEDALDKHIREVVGNPTELTLAANVVPKRVIFWTTPYKQLQKDPRLFVQVYSALETIDNLERSKRPEIPEPLRDRVAAGMRDAEVKNEALWKLYVFLSDGLYYTGVLAKLNRNHECGADSEHHKKHLEMARNIALRALRCAWKDWESVRGDPNAQLDHVLSESMSVENLRRLLLLFSNGAYEFREYDQRLLTDVSSVAFDQYLHGDRLENCRDIRYKFDSRKTLAEVLASSNLLPERKQVITELIQASGRAIDDFSTEELEEIVARFGTTRLDIGKALQKMAARGESLLDPQFLQEVWREDLASLRNR